VEVLGTYNGWAKINYEGVWRWVSAVYLKAGSSQVTVTFDANGGTASYSSGTYVAGASFGSLPTATKDKRTFAGWVSGGTTYTASSTVPTVSTLLLKAQWCVLTYQDVTEDKWYASYVETAYDQGLISKADRFYPDSNASRCQMVTVLGREYERETGTTISGDGTKYYSDVVGGSYYSSYVAWGAENGIVKGIGDRKFAPDDNVTREQIAVFLYRFAIFRGAAAEATVDRSVLDRFEDSSQVSDFALDAVCWAVKVGILKGDDRGCLNPKSSAQRSEMITMFSRYISYWNETGISIQGDAVATVNSAPETVTVTFDGNGGTVSQATAVYTPGAALSTLPTAEQEGYVFQGWFDGETQYTEDSAAPAVDMTLTAHWEAIPVEETTEETTEAPDILGDLEAETQVEAAQLETMLTRTYQLALGDEAAQWQPQETQEPESVTPETVLDALYAMAQETGAVTEVPETQTALSWAQEEAFLTQEELDQVTEEAPLTCGQVAQWLQRYLTWCQTEE
jgi:uncharacterized repeat protein (TIGR02543 family)